MEKKSLIFIAGHTGLVGSALFRNLHSKGYLNIIKRNRKELDQLNQEAVNKFFEESANISVCLF